MIFKGSTNKNKKNNNGSSEKYSGVSRILSFYFKQIILKNNNISSNVSHIWIAFSCEKENSLSMTKCLFCSRNHLVETILHPPNRCFERVSPIKWSLQHDNKQQSMFMFIPVITTPLSLLYFIFTNRHEYIFLNYLLLITPNVKHLQFSLTSIELMEISWGCSGLSILPQLRKQIRLKLSLITPILSLIPSWWYFYTPNKLCYLLILNSWWKFVFRCCYILWFDIYTRYTPRWMLIHIFVLGKKKTVVCCPSKHPISMKKY